MADWYAGMPTFGARALGDRSNIPGGRIARIIFCLHDGQMYLLNGFIKKTQKTPSNELELARKRRREVTQ